MPNKQMLKVMINERLSEAAEQIFALFEQSVAEYQREIDRLKNVSDAKPLECAPSSQSGSEVAERTLAGCQKHEEDTISFLFKEETDQLMVTEDKSLMQITNVKSLDNGEESHRQQQNTNSEGPEASGGAESDHSFVPTSESEEEDPDSDSDEETFGSNTPKKPYSCSVCKKRFPHKRGIKMHMKRAHTSEKPVTSAECYAQLDIEQQSQPDVDSKNRPFSCTVCTRQFKRKFTLEAHMREHTGGNPFHCSVCVASFLNHVDFTCHIKTVHSTENPFKCSVCNRSLKNLRNYKSHMLIHTGERPFLCPVCGRGFLQKGNLRYHMLTHTGEKPFRCTECGARYTSKQNLMHHKKANH